MRTPKLPEIGPKEDEEPAKKETPKPAKVTPEDDFDALAARFAALKKR